jgi:hypothetical protein
MVIERATDLDLPEVLGLLGRHHLPLAGVREHRDTMIVASAWSVDDFAGNCC